MIKKISKVWIDLIVSIKIKTYSNRGWGKKGKQILEATIQQAKI